MGPLEFICELCSLDSDYIRGWRWLFSARYREEVRMTRHEQSPLVFVLGALLSMLLMLAEVVAVVFIIRWLLRL